MERGTVGFVRQSVGGGGGGGVLRLPPGFRFYPTDEELVVQYLKRKAFSCPLPASIIPDIELSRYDPWDLPGGDCKEKERYFFTLRGAKYRNANKSSRAAGSGYWRATGKDKQITASKTHMVVGLKKKLVFYRNAGKSSHGSRTDWVMQEYRLPPPGPTTPVPMEDWVLCRVSQKAKPARNHNSEMVESATDEAGSGRMSLIGFAGRRGVEPSGSESSCVTDIADHESGSGEDEETSSSSSSRLLLFRGET